eukprot:CAMPEP_0179225586 /NCGR_PEP_ID=MMETSP0797-20121207/8384_1 /TAXON_ID=47934 /ORGANISM="Dinophysis acuminata, Strain DAEP01" /LENGTH=370 /DNA_ID=CAMNT_0020932607 /DNA_START=78 /DNA_END=1187 /DNA_ORIENTATION=-
MKSQEMSLMSGAPGAGMDMYVQAAGRALPHAAKLLLDELASTASTASTATQEREDRQAWPKEPPSGPDEASARQELPLCVQKQLRKTKLCVHHLRGGCRQAGSCNFAHAMSELLAVPDLRSTQLCKMFIAGACHDEHCKFAHARGDVRSTGMFYKNALCAWYKRGLCRNGSNCRFAHGPSELKAGGSNSADLSADARGSDLRGGSKGWGKGAMGREEPRWNRDNFGGDAGWGYPQQQQQQAFLEDPMHIQPQQQQQEQAFLEDPMYIQPHSSPQRNQESNHALKQALETVVHEYRERTQWLDAAARSLSPAEAAALRWAAAGPGMHAGPPSTAGGKATDTNVSEMRDQIKTLMQHVERLERQVQQAGPGP